MREAMALGLDRDDTVIRRRLRQKFEFAAEDAFDATPPTDAELQAFLDTHPDTVPHASRGLRLRQVHLGPQRGNACRATRAQLLARLQAAGPDADIDGAGRLALLPARGLEHTARGDVARMFGDEFAGALLKAAPGRWVGPVRSGYGLHVVIVASGTAGGCRHWPTCGRWSSATSWPSGASARSTRCTRKLLARYPVVIETAQPGGRSVGDGDGIGARAMRRALLAASIAWLLLWRGLRCAGPRIAARLAGTSRGTARAPTACCGRSRPAARSRSASRRCCPAECRARRRRAATLLTPGALVVRGIAHVRRRHPGQDPVAIDGLESTVTDVHRPRPPRRRPARDPPAQADEPRR